jgi:hypothetical protein
MENYFETQRDHIFRNVEVLIYVFDIESRDATVRFSPFGFSHPPEGHQLLPVVRRGHPAELSHSKSILPHSQDGLDPRRSARCREWPCRAPAQL